jgi:hypothetical protein
VPNQITVLAGQYSGRVVVKNIGSERLGQLRDSRQRLGTKRIADLEREVRAEHDLLSKLKRES